MKDRLEGKLIRIYKDLRYGFIKYNNTDYFFHKDDYLEDWNALVLDFERNPPVLLEFRPDSTPKGLRARDVRFSPITV